MKHEYSAGAVLVERNYITLYFVLVIEMDGHCGFPKGHIEENESDKKTALREIFEETGIQAKIVDGFEISHEYKKTNNVMKHVTYFLAEYKNQLIKCNFKEVSDVLKLTFTEAIDKLTYDSIKGILVKANKYYKNYLSFK